MYYPDFIFIACFVVCIVGGLVWIYAQLREFQVSLLNLRREITLQDIKTDEVREDIKRIEKDTSEAVGNTRVIINKLYEK